MFNSFVSAVCQFDDYYQKMLFDVLDNSSLFHKADFLRNVMPLQETAVPTESLLRLVNCDFGEYLDDIIDRRFNNAPCPKFTQSPTCFSENSQHHITKISLKQEPKITLNKLVH